MQRLRHPRAVAGEVLANALEFTAPGAAFEAEQLLARLVGQLDARQVQVFRPRQRADRGVDRAGLALHPADHPFQNAQVVTEARPQEAAVVALAEPVDVEHLRQLRAGLVERQPVRSEEHTSEIQSQMRISYALFYLTKKKN